MTGDGSSPVSCCFYRQMELIQATTEEQIEAARELFKEYAAGLAIDMCFQSFDHELQTLPGKYATPDGRLLLVYAKDELAGCIALRKLDDRTCRSRPSGVAYFPGR